MAQPYQRTAVNTEAKYLLLRHAFEAMDCIRVCLKTDSLNQRSRNAIARIGAKEEGIRHTVYFSVAGGEKEARSNITIFRITHSNQCRSSAATQLNLQR